MGALGFDENHRQDTSTETSVEQVLDGEIMENDDSLQGEQPEMQSEPSFADRVKANKKPIVAGFLFSAAAAVFFISSGSEETPAPLSVEDMAVQAVEGNRPLAGIKQDLGQDQITNKSIIDEFSSNTKDVVMRLREYRETTGSIPSYQTPPAWAYKDWNDYEVAPSTARVKIYEGEIYYDDIEAAPVTDGNPDETARVVQDTFKDPEEETATAAPQERGVVGQIADSLRGSKEEVMQSNPLGSKLEFFKMGGKLLGGL